MLTRKIVLSGLLALFAGSSVGQSALPIATNVEKAFKKNTRSWSGKPGASYWQNTADYSLKVKFNPETRELSGTALINYVNNSPDTLRQLVFKLYPNLYQKGAPRASRIAPEDINDGMKIEKLTVNDNVISRLRPQNTNMTVIIPPLAGKKSAKISVTYSYILNKGSHNRTGQVDPGAFFIAYFFPRVAVYDDIDGWNMNPYRGSEEFYNDFCNFEAEITLPEKYAAWATGDLTNAAGVFTPAIVKRIAAAEKSDEVIDVIDSADLKSNQVTTAGEHTWKFSAKNVTDFAFAISNHYLWKSKSLVVDPATGRRTRVDAVFNPAHKDYYEVIGFADKTVQLMSYTFPKWPFPYAHETVFDGLDQMEYPMMVNDNPVQDRTDAITLTDHEIFHTMFPFYMGINETKYGWMDEGWATIGEWLISPMIDKSIVDEYGMSAYSGSAGTEADLPIMTLTTQQVGAGSFTNIYPKPAMGYLYVKDLLGDELFTRALHYYISQWNGKHPIPYDFFNCMNAGSGKNLDWFWKRWFFDSGVPNLGIASVKQAAGQCNVVVAAIGTKPVPVDLSVFYADGSSEKFHRSIAVWETGSKAVTVSFKATKQVEKVVLGSTYVPDTDKKNNMWTR
ncbi:M1 family metallopeptidase [Hufsiella ginkgonis]|uniref:Peptidase n=1 Tax=Hufsiella ginkgonis TaxID=2695274 RepID=A0A7K1XZV0_9SPHI|nr:M1 family metallopeptidase [Hufsiella ginkgonis]MXV16328.1 peptidase [Hufsiella ginkgonis]